MANVVTEHVLLLVPMMLVLVLFPMVTNLVVGNYMNEQRLIIVEGAGNKLASTIQQLYLTMSLSEVQACTVTVSNPLPATIEDQDYIITADLVGDTLTLHISLPGVQLIYHHSLTIGEQAEWISSTLNGNLLNSGIEAVKNLDGSIVLRFR
jgi:uncharacterized protein YejL (UPF0352 family)